MRSSVGVERDFRGDALTLHRLTQESLGRIHIPLPAQVEIDRLARLIHGPIQIHPLPFDPDVRFIHPPGVTYASCKPFPALLELRTIMLHPTENGRVHEVDTAFIHHGHEVAIAQLVAEVPANAQDHDLLVEVPTFEKLPDRYEPW